MTSTHAEIVSKGQFAALRNVTPGRVSQWIAERKIKGPAIIGEGRNAQIHVALATQQLRNSLDINQRAGNGLETNLDLPPPVPAYTPELPGTTPKPHELPIADPIDEHIKRERLEQLRRANRKLAEEEAARAGRFTDAAESTRRMGAIAAQMITVVEGSLSEIATALSARFQVPQRDVLHLLHAELRKVRASGAKMFREQAAALPEMVEAELKEKETA